MFRVGQKVVCVNAAPRDGGYWDPLCWKPLVERRVYTVRDVVLGHTHGVYGPGLLLEEILNPISHDGIEYNYDVSRFRPVVEHKTDISIFTAMLNPSKRRVDA